MKQQDKHFYEADYKRIAEIGYALAHPLRLRIVEILLQHSHNECVQDFSEILGKKQANISQHLAILRSLRIIDYHQEGRKRCYYIKSPQLMRRIIENLKKIVRVGI